MASMRKETDSLGIVEVPEDKLWGAQTQMSGLACQDFDRRPERSCVSLVVEPLQSPIMPTNGSTNER